MPGIVHVLLLVAAAVYPMSALAAECLDRGPARPIDRTYSIAEMEAIGMAIAKAVPSTPQVPFGNGYEGWKTFVAKHRAGDTIRGFELAEIGYIGGDIPHGIFLMRKDCIIAMLGFVMP